jgi:hypothetical protein
MAAVRLTLSEFRYLSQADFLPAWARLAVKLSASNRVLDVSDEQMSDLRDTLLHVLDTRGFDRHFILHPKGNSLTVWLTSSLIELCAEQNRRSPALTSVPDRA